MSHITSAQAWMQLINVNWVEDPRTDLEHKPPYKHDSYCRVSSCNRHICQDALVLGRRGVQNADLRRCIRYRDQSMHRVNERPRFNWILLKGFSVYTP